MNQQELGERIRIARERRGLSQAELANMISKDQRAVSEYENGGRRIWINDLPALAEALDVNLMYFFEGELTPGDLEYQLLMVFRELDDDHVRESAIDLMKAFRKALEQPY